MSSNDPGPSKVGRAVSLWLTGGIVLTWLVVLAVLIDNVVLAIQLWVVSVTLVLLLARGLNNRRHSLDTRDLGQPVDKPSVRAEGIQPVVLTGDEVASLLRLDRAIVIKAIHDGLLPGNHIGDHWRVRTATLAAWLDGAYGSPPEADWKAKSG